MAVQIMDRMVERRESLFPDLRKIIVSRTTSVQFPVVGSPWKCVPPRYPNLVAKPEREPKDEAEAEKAEVTRLLQGGKTMPEDDTSRRYTVLRKRLQEL